MKLFNDQAFIIQLLLYETITVWNALESRERFTLVTSDPSLAPELILNDSPDLQWQEKILHTIDHKITTFFHFRIFNPIYFKVFRIYILSILNEESHFEWVLLLL